MATPLKQTKNKGGLPKGRTNNPNGRPKGKTSLAQALRENPKTKGVLNKVIRVAGTLDT